MNSPPPSYHGSRFPSEIIAHTVRLYFRFSLSFRGVGAYSYLFRRTRHLRLAQRDPALTQRAGLHDVTPCHRGRPPGSAGVARGVLQSANLWA